MTNAEARRVVLVRLRESPVTAPLIWEAEKSVRPIFGELNRAAFEDAVILEAGLADVFRREVERVRRKGRR
jgi:hypothetical protein